MSDRWYRFLCHTLSRAYYHRIALVDAANARALDGAVLYVGLHRNGAVDGLVYKHLFPRATFLISSQLTRSWFGRLFFTGIPVTRTKDRGDRSFNAASLERCAGHLVAGNALFVLPEGTSDLGPRHLPFKPGVSRILERALTRGAAVTVVPVGIFYSCAEAFRSDVTVVAGPPIAAELPAGLDPDERAAQLLRRIADALETLSVGADSPAALVLLEQCAGVVGEEPGAVYYAALKTAERTPMPPEIAAEWRAIADDVTAGRVGTARGVPVVSRRGLAWNVGWLALQSVFVAAAALLNLPVLVGAWLAGRRLADARNTIALWRLMAGAPLGTLWILFVAATAVATGNAGYLVAYAALTTAGLMCYPELIARWPRVRNHPRRRELGARIARVRTWLETAMHAPGTSAPRTTAQAVGGSQTTPRADAAAGVSHGHG